MWSTYKQGKVSADVLGVSRWYTMQKTKPIKNSGLHLNNFPQQMRLAVANAHGIQAGEGDETGGIDVMDEPRRLPPTGDVPGLGLVPLLIEVCKFAIYLLWMVRSPCRTAVAWSPDNLEPASDRALN